VGTTTVIETDFGVRFPIVKMLIDPSLVQTLSLGGRLLLISPPGMRPLDIWQQYRENFSAEELAARLRIFSVAGTEGLPPEAKPVMLPLVHRTGPDPDPIFQVAYQFVRERSANSVPNMIARTTGGERSLKETLGAPVSGESFASTASAYVAGMNAHQIVIGNRGDPLLMSIIDSGSLYLQVLARQGRHFLNGVRPFTPSYAIVEGTGVGPFRLVRMV
jgi:hypothetical protein